MQLLYAKFRAPVQPGAQSHVYPVCSWLQLPLLLQGAAKHGFTVSCDVGVISKCRIDVALAPMQLVRLRDPRSKVSA